MATKFFVANAAINRWRIISLAGVCCALFVGGFIFNRPVNADSVVQTIICREGATLSVAQPVSDSVVVDATLPVTGTVAQANQIEITIDGQFDGVIPLSAAATTFSTTVQLTPGTHTVRLTALDACQIANAVGIVVVTYQAPPTTATGSVGGETDTTVPAGGGVVIGGESSQAVQSGAPTLLERIAQPFIDLGRQLNLIDNSAQVTPQQIAIPQFVRFSLVVAGLGAIIFSTQVARLGGALRFGFASKKVLRRLVPTVIGFGLLAIAFLL